MFPRSIVVLAALFSAAFASIFLISTAEIGGLGLILAVAGLLMILIRPLQRPPLAFAALIVLAAGAAFLSFLPAACFPASPFRTALSELGVVPIASSVTLQPEITKFWAAFFLISAVSAVYMSTFPLRTRGLELFAAVVTVLIGTYALLAIIARETGWKPVFHNDAPFGFFPNRNHTATLLAVGAVSSIGLAFHHFRHFRSWRGTLGVVTAVIPVIGLLFYSESRAGVLLVGLGGVLWIAGIGPRVISGAGWCATGVLIAAAGYFFVTEANPVRARLGDLAGSLPVAGAEGDFRVKIFRDTVAMTRDYPVTGVGIGNFEAVFRQYRKSSVLESDALHPESDFLYAAAEMGWPSAVLLLGAAGVLVYGAFRGRGEEVWPVRWALASGAIVAALHGFVDVPWHRPQLAWVLLSVAMAGTIIPRQRPDAGRLAQGIFVLIGIGVLGAGVWLAAIQWGGAKQPEALIGPRLMKRIQQAAAEHRYEDAEALSGRAIVAAPLGGWPYLYMGTTLLAWEGTDQDVVRYFQAWRMIDPIWPRVSIQEAKIWEQVNLTRAAEAYADALFRARQIDLLVVRPEKLLPRVAGDVLRETGKNPALQEKFGDVIWNDAELRALWIGSASPDLVSARLAATGLSLKEVLDGISPQLSENVLQRWNALGRRDEACRWILAAREASGDRLGYWQSLSQAFAQDRNFEGAVREGAAGRGIEIEARWMLPDADTMTLSSMEKELRGLLLKRNEVAGNRIVGTALKDKSPLESTLLTATQYYVQIGEWEKAWQTMERIPTKRR